MKGECPFHARQSFGTRIWRFLRGTSGCYIFNGTKDNILLSRMSIMKTKVPVKTIAAGDGWRIYKNGDTYQQHWAALNATSESRCISSDLVNDYECIHVVPDESPDNTADRQRIRIELGNRR